MRARPFSIKVYIPGIMKQKSSSDMDVSSGEGSGEGAYARASGVRIEELGDDSRARAGSGEGSKGSNVNPFSVPASGSVDGPRPMFRPSTHILNAPATPSANADEAFRTSRPSVAGTPNAAEALAMMMHHEYPEGLPEDVHGVSHFGAGHDDEPPLMDYAGEADMDVGYDDEEDNYGADFPAAPRKRTASGPPHKRLRAEMDRRKSLALAGLQAAEGGVRRSTRQRSKPLEYWRGETKVYQRVHNSLPTVVQIEKRTANPIWPRKTPGGPSQPFRISRLRPAEVLRDIGGELPEPSPLDRRGVKYGLMPPPAPASWAEKYGIHPLTSRPSVTPGKAPHGRHDDEEEGIALKPAKKRRGRPVGSKNRKNASVEDVEEHVVNDDDVDLVVASVVSDMFANVLAANRTPEEIEAEEQAEADAALEAQAVAEVEAEMAAFVTERDVEEDTPLAVAGVMEAIAEEEDEEERQLERELDAAVADAERELAEELAAEAEATAVNAASEDVVVVEDVEESFEDAASAGDDAVELNVDFSRADTEATTSRDAEEEEPAVEQPVVASVLTEIDANEEDVDMMDVDEPPSAQKLADALDDATNDENAPRRRTRSRGASLAPSNV